MKKAVLIFEKKFPKVSIEDNAVHGDEHEAAENMPRQWNSASKCLKIIGEAVRVSIPGRIEAGREFVNQAKKWQTYILWIQLLWNMRTA